VPPYVSLNRFLQLFYVGALADVDFFTGGPARPLVAFTCCTAMGNSSSRLDRFAGTYEKSFARLERDVERLKVSEPSAQVCLMQRQKNEFSKAC
jgi:hypothetical protein